MSVSTRCPSCKKTLKAPEAALGKRTRCPACKQIIVFQPGESVLAGQNPGGSQIASTPPASPPARSTPPPVPAAQKSAPTTSASTASSDSGLAVNSKWYVSSHDGNQYGPVEKSELDVWSTDGGLTGRCQVCRAGELQWQPASTLYPHLGQPAQSPAAAATASSVPPATPPATPGQPTAPAASVSPGQVAFDGQNFDPNLVAAVPTSPLGKYHEKNRQAVTKMLEKECAKLGSARITSAVGIPLDESKGNSIWGQVEFRTLGAFDVEPDVLVVVEISTADGDLFVVSPREKSTPLPHEFVSIMPGRLPSPIALGRGLLGKFSRGQWQSAHEGQAAALCAVAEQNTTLSDGAKWDWKMSAGQMVTTIKLKWTIQAIPLGQTHFLLLAKTPLRMGIPPKFGLDWFLQRRAAMAQFIAAAAGQDPGQCYTQFCYPTNALYPLMAKLGGPILAAHQF